MCLDGLTIFEAVHCPGGKKVDESHSHNLTPNTRCGKWMGVALILSGERKARI